MTEPTRTTSLTELSCAQFTEALCSVAPIPGGGGAAALTASLAASLTGMAAGLTRGKKKFLAYEEDYLRIIRKADALRVRFLQLAEADAAAFEPLSKAYSLDRSVPEAFQVFRSAALNAASPPFSVMQGVNELTALLEELLPRCSCLMLSDLGCAASHAAAALESAALNVFVNTGCLPGDAEAQALEAEAAAMLHEGLPRLQVIAGTVRSELCPH